MKMTKSKVEGLPNDALLEIAHSLSDSIDATKFPEGFFEEPNSITDEERAVITDHLWDKMPSAIKEEAPEPAPKVDGQVRKPRKQPLQATPKFAGIAGSPGNPLRPGTSNFVTFELLYRQGGCTSKEIGEVFEANGVRWQDYTVCLYNFKPGASTRPKALGAPDHHIFAKELPEPRDNSRAFCLWHNKKRTWLYKVPVEEWDFPQK